MQVNGEAAATPQGSRGSSPRCATKHGSRAHRGGLGAGRSWRPGSAHGRVRSRVRRVRSSPCRAAPRQETYAVQQNQVAKRGGTSEKVDMGNRDQLSGHVGSGLPREVGGSTGAVEIRGCVTATAAGKARTPGQEAVPVTSCETEGTAGGATAKPTHSVRCGNIWECGTGSMRPPSAGAAVRIVRCQRRWYVIEPRPATGTDCPGRSAAVLAPLVLPGVCRDGHGIGAESSPSRLNVPGQSEQGRTIATKINRQAGSPTRKG